MLFRHLKKKQLYKLYIIQKKSSCQISKELNIPVETILWNLRYFKIPRRTFKEAKNLNWNNPKYRKMMSKKHFGHIHTEKQKEKISKSLKGKLPKNFDLLHTIYEQKRIKNLRRGKNHPLWSGGFDKKDYPYTFNKKLKELIRNRDGHKCQVCGAPECEFKGNLAVHHIDYNKKNININNLISLCKYCHTKTNYNREKWTELFNKKLCEVDNW